MPLGDAGARRIISPAVKVLERDLRRKGHLAEDEHFSGWCAGELAALYERGEASPDRPRTPFPWSKPQLLAAFTEKFMLFSGLRFNRSCPLPAVYRAEVYQDRVRVLFTTEATRRLSMIEIAPVDREVESFVEDLLFQRDLAASGLPNLEQHMAGVQEIRSVPPEEVLNTLVLGSWEPQAK